MLLMAVHGVLENRENVGCGGGCVSEWVSEWVCGQYRELESQSVKTKFGA